MPTVFIKLRLYIGNKMPLFYEIAKAKLGKSKYSPVEQEPGQFTVGDLHGNAAKLLFILFEHGIASGLSKSDHDMLYYVYNTPVAWLTAEDLATFIRLINKMQLNKNFRLRLIGDELCDRGENDYFTLLILQRLKKDIVVDILLSNHGALFLAAYSSQNFSSKNLHEGQERSMHNMQFLLAKKLIDRKSVNTLIEESYIPSLKLIDFVLSWDRNKLIICTHAPAGLNAIEAVAKKFKITYNAATVLQLCHTINLINDEFSTRLRNEDINQLYQPFQYDSSSDHNTILRKDPIGYLLWNRNVVGLPQAKSIGGCDITFIHGHEGDSGVKNHRICLNDMFGKSNDNYKGAHRYVYYSSAEFNLEYLLHERTYARENRRLTEKLQDLRDQLLRVNNANVLLQTQLQQERSLRDEQQDTVSEPSQLEHATIQVCTDALITEQEKLMQDVLNSEPELNCQHIITKKLMPLTENYLRYLVAKIPDSLKIDVDFISMTLLEQVNAIKPPPRTNAGSLFEKFDRIRELYIVLSNETMDASDRLDLFRCELKSAQKLIQQHRDPVLMRYMLNAAIVLAIVVTGIVPGLCVLGLLALHDKPVRFWQASGHTFFNAASAHTQSNVADIDEAVTTAPLVKG